MKAVILAAGQNSRILTSANGLPKTLIKISNNEILKIILNNLTKIPIIDEVIIVVGYQKHLIKKKIGISYKNIKIKYVTNNDYKKTNSMYSLWLTKKYISNELLIINGDTIFSKNFLSSFIKLRKDALIYLDKNRSNLNNEALKVLVNKNLLVSNVGKNVKKTKKTFSSPAIYIFRKSQLKNFFNIIESRFIFKNKKQYLISKAVDCFAKNFKLNIYYSKKNDFWLEIDNSRDLTKAKKMFKNI